MSRRDHDTSPDAEAPMETPATVDQAHLDKNRLASTRLEPGGKIGRYLVIDVLGEGGMGVVYRAYDPELDRRVALKLVRVARRDEQQAARARTRLLREAQALAKLSHPNVIAVHDAGTYGDNVFVAMELVEGSALRTWLRQSRTEREILAVFIAAGRGLAAAHDAGLVHRDFKPENVIVGTDGRVRVLDFGLARASTHFETSDDTGEVRTPPPEARTPAELETGPNRLSEPLTLEGAVMGTPAYMSPEQHAQGRADARSDQFSFCVALHEALCGRRPTVAGPTDKNPADASQVRKLRPWLHRIIHRGLSLAPDQRYRSMNALLAALAKNPAARRRVVAVAAIMTALAGTAVFAVVRATGSEDRCGGAHAKLARVWDGPIRNRIEAAFASTARGHARATATRVADLIDNYTTAWATFHTESCRATDRGDQSDRMFDVRTACLQRRLGELAALTGLFASNPGPAVVDNSIAAVMALPPIAYCRDDKALTAAIPLPDDPALRARVDALRYRLDEVHALELAGEFGRALAPAEVVAADSRAIEFPPIRAEALAALAVLYQDSGQHEKAEELFREVVQLAGAARDDRLVVSAQIRLVELAGRLPGRLAEAIALVPVTTGIIARLDNQSSYLGDLEMALATAHHRAGKYDEARKYFERALAQNESDGGKDQVQLASILTNFGVLLETQGRYDEARTQHLRALAIDEEMLGREHPDLAAPLNNLANAALRQGKYDDAEAYHLRALAIMEKALAPDHPEVATSLNNLAIVYQERGDYPRASELYQRALDILSKVLGPDDPTVGVGLNNLGEVLLLGGKPRDAVSHYQRALAVWAKGLPPDHPMNGYALTGLGKSLVELDTAGDAIAPLQRALAIRSTSGEDPVLAAETRFALARALWESQGDRSDAIENARSALTAYRAGGEHHAKQVSEIEAWLETHRKHRK